MGRPKKTPDIRGAEALAEIRNAFAEKDRRLQEFEDSIEPQRHAIRVECEAAILTAIAAARMTPSLSKRSMMNAARAMNWDRWKKWEERTDPLLSTHRPSWASEVIERELTWDEIGELNQFHFGVNSVIDPETEAWVNPGTIRAFKMRGLKFPHPTNLKDKPGNDVILYRPDEPLTDHRWEPHVGNNPCWANQDSAPVGEAREQILKAILEWVGETP